MRALPLPETVVLADGDGGFRSRVAAALGGMGVEVVAVGDGRAALAVLAARGVDVVVINGSSLEAVGRIRAAGYGVPVLVLTDTDAAEERIAGLEAGADDSLSKPFTTDELAARLRALIRRSGRRYPVAVSEDPPVE